MSEETLHSNQSRIIEQTKFIYSPVEKNFRKTNKNNQGKNKLRP